MGLPSLETCSECQQIGAYKLSNEQTGRPGIDTAPLIPTTLKAMLTNAYAKISQARGKTATLPQQASIWCAKFIFPDNLNYLGYCISVDGAANDTILLSADNSPQDRLIYSLELNRKKDAYIKNIQMQDKWPIFIIKAGRNGTMHKTDITNLINTWGLEQGR